MVFWSLDILELQGQVRIGWCDKDTAYHLPRSNIIDMIKKGKTRGSMASHQYIQPSYLWSSHVSVLPGRERMISPLP